LIIKNRIFAHLVLVTSLVLGIALALSCVSLVFAIAEERSLYQTNENGSTYGTMEHVAKNPLAEAPDLIATIGIDGTYGYCYKADIDGDQPSNPEESVKYMEELNRKITIAIENGEEFLWYIPLYESDGVMVIGKHGISIPYIDYPEED
jgi:MFS superfamily sulfate permease-like transporter